MQKQAGGGSSYETAAKKLFDNTVAGLNRQVTENREDVVERIHLYQNLAKDESDYIEIAETELPNMYERFIQADKTVNNLFNDHMRGKLTQEQEAEYRKAESDCVNLKRYMRVYESHVSSEYKKKREAMGITDKTMKYY